MASPLEQSGAIREPSEYACLTMDRQFTGLFTQRSPLRDAAVEYIIAKFYGGSRFDSIIDGLNREISSRLTDVRRPGSSVYNSNTFPAINSFYAFKQLINGTEFIRVLADGKDGNIYDATAGQKSTLLAKAAGAGKARFLGVSDELFIGDGVDQKKWLTPGPWQESTAVLPGTLISNGAEPGTLQMALGGISMPIVATSSNGTLITIYVNPQNVPYEFPNLLNAKVTFAGLTAATSLNGNTYAMTPVSTTMGTFTVPQVQAAYAETADTGTGTTGTGTTGGSAPAFSATEFTVVADGGQQWKCYGTAMENWGLPGPINTPTLTMLNGARLWQPNTIVSHLFSVLDLNGNVQVASQTTSGSVYKTGFSYPKWGESPFVVGSGPGFGTGNVTDGTIVWLNFGPIGSWSASTTYMTTQVIIDANQNLQTTNPIAITGPTGSTAPVTWATTIGATTTDGGTTWTCLGPGVVLATAPVSYAFSTHGVDGSVSTCSPPLSTTGPILGQAASAGPYLSITGKYVVDPQIDQLYIYRTAQGQATLILEDQIAADTAAGSFTYNEPGIPDTSANGGGSLNALIAAPIDLQGSPPPTGITGMVYHLGRTWGFVGNTVYYSGGPDTLTGNGNTAWPPINFIPYPEQVIRLVPFTVNNGGMMVITTSNTYVILGTGTFTNPFYTTIYMPGVGILSYDALDTVGSTLYLVTSKLKAVSLDPSAGYVEFGFPIGDQFNKVTTGAISAALYTAANTYVTWHEAASGDTAVYVSDGAAGWFRFAPVASPESGYVWSPRAAIVGGTSAVQSIETTPGFSQLLIGPPNAGGPILFRDLTTNADWSGGSYVPYPSWDVKGNIVLCQSGEVSEIAHIALKSMARGARPLVGVLLGEIAASTATPFETLSPTSCDPPILAPSQTTYSDRYVLEQNGCCPKCDNFQLKVDYGTQNVADELLMFSVYGAKHAERKQQ